MSSNEVTTGALAELAQRMGIALEFRDARGNSIRTQPDTQRRLLQAMGIHADDDTQVEDANLALDRAAWSRALPPVKVARKSTEPVTIDLVMPQDVGRIRWRLKVEGGTELSDEIAFSTLSLVASAADGPSLERRRLRLPMHEVPIGYHELMVEPGGHTMSFILSPTECWFPTLPAGERRWGIAAQLYLLRSTVNWGIGDFGDLEALVRIAAGKGADLIGLNPLHALFAENPQSASPYSPASRLLLNVLNIDVKAIPELRESRRARELMDTEEFRDGLRLCRERDRVDYVEVARLKTAILEVLFEECRALGDQSRWQAFASFKAQQGTTLELNCLFLTLREYFIREDPTRGNWHSWPPEYRDANSPSVRAFAQQHSDRLSFFQWMQWVADDQLAATQRATADSGMRIGLYRDLAVGADHAGAETWIAPQVVCDAHVGAPPDVHNPAGQDWGLPPFNPHALFEEGYRSFIDLIRTNMRSAGGLRIDHAMGLQQLYWIPLGAGAAEGAYVHYPVEDLLGILKLESHRNRCIVVGEDLGTVPEGFREKMTQAGILSYRVLYFEQAPNTAKFISPDQYPARSLAVSGSHDLPTLHAWWEARDIDLKLRLGLFPAPEEESRQRDARQRDKLQLLKALRREKLIKATDEVDIGQLVRAAHIFLARSQSVLAMAQLDDLTDEVEPVNVPGTSSEHSNWSRRLSVGVEELLGNPLFDDIMKIFAAERRAV
jgi:4-alpha-glucanotransferase